MHVDTNNCKSFPEEQILTHVIDGFIIEESLSPFPVCALMHLKVFLWIVFLIW